MEGSLDNTCLLKRQHRGLTARPTDISMRTIPQVEVGWTNCNSPGYTGCSNQKSNRNHFLWNCSIVADHTIGAKILSFINDKWVQITSEWERIQWQKGILNLQNHSLTDFCIYEFKNSSNQTSYRKYVFYMPTFIHYLH